MLIWAHLSPNPKQHLDLFSHCCTAHSRQSLYFTMGPFPQKIASSHGDVDLVPALFIVPWTQPSPGHKRHLDRFSCFCRVHGRASLYLAMAAPLSKIAPSYGGNLDSHLIHRTLGLPESSIQTASRSVGATFAGLTTVTDHATRLVTINRIYVHIIAMRPKIQ